MKPQSNPITLWVTRWVWAGAKILLSVAFAAVIVATLYAVTISDDIDKRFEGRLWSVPSRVYSDGLAIYPGQSLSLRQLVQRLDRLGYRPTKRRPLAVGEYRRSDKTVTVYLRPIELPVFSREAIAVRVTFSGKKATRVRKLTDGHSGEAVHVVELEPEELLQVFGEHHESRQLVSINDVPKELISAVLAAEDADFYEHSGVDIAAVFRAMYVNAKAGTVRQGGSTLTQQLAKTVFLTPERTIVRKLKELIIALVIESKYSKDKILEIYFNEIYLGQRGAVAVHGFGEAARFYFGRPIQKLNAAQAATLAGIIRGPNKYSPYQHPKAALAQRNRVLTAMYENGDLDEQTVKAATKSPLGTIAYSPYKRTAPYFFDYVATQMSTMYPDADLTELGLSLYTTIDVGVQAEAERALQKGLKALEKKHAKLKRPEGEPRLQGAVVVLQPNTGHVLAMVGGRDYGESQFNRITQALRQPGSAFKPFVFLSSFDQMTLADTLNNDAKTYKADNGKRWSPKNYDGQYGGRVPLRKALAKSLNLPTVDLADTVGLERIINTARNFGITTKLEPHLSMALGSFEVYPIELVTAYAAFAHDGVLPKALSLRSVVGEDGKVMKRQHFKLRTVTTPRRAYMMTSALKDVVDRGTGQGLKSRGVRFAVAGKTGTTNDYRDAWFVGYTPDLVTLVWVGFDDSQSIGLAASRAALPIWADLMSHIGWRVSGRWFEAPEGLTHEKVCFDTGELATSGCPHTVDEVFEDPERVPSESCHEHRSSFRRFLDAIGL